jgi:hypothetical protein
MSLIQIDEIVAPSTDGRPERAGMPVSSIYPGLVRRIMVRIIRLHAGETTKLDGLW